MDPISLPDSHCHLDLDEFAADREAVLKRAREAGVSAFLCPADVSLPAGLQTVLELAARHPDITAAAGLHPHQAKHRRPDQVETLRALAADGKIAAVGEIGLDYHYDLSPREEQRAAFRWQLALARERGLPVVLHHREAWDDFLSILDEHPGLPGVAHSFTEGTGGATAMMGRGLLIGISGMATFPRGDNIRDAARTALPARLLVETDAPYLAPVPHRGKRNEPAFVRLVAETVAQVRGVALADFERETDTAFRSLFLQGQ